MSSFSRTRESQSKDKEWQQLAHAVKQSLKHPLKTDEQSDALDAAIQTLASKCFQESSYLWKTELDIQQRFVQLLKTCDLRYEFYPILVESDSFTIKFKIEKLQFSFNRIVNLFTNIVANHNPNWNYYVFSSNFQLSTAAEDQFQLTFTHRSDKPSRHFTLPKSTLSLSQLIRQLTDSNEELVYVDSPPPEDPFFSKNAWQTLTDRLNLRQYLPSSPFKKPT